MSQKQCILPSTRLGLVEIISQKTEPLPILQAGAELNNISSAQNGICVIDANLNPV